jgi:hypothetical protein
MAKKLLAVRFDAVNKQQINGRVGHTRTGACTAKGKCYHGRIRPRRRR